MRLFLTLTLLSPSLATTFVSPEDCVREMSMYDFMLCFESFIKPVDSVNSSQYEAIKPKPQELLEWKRLSLEMLEAESSSDCQEIRVSPVLKDQVTLQTMEFCIELEDKTEECEKYCLLYEILLGNDEKFARGFGMFAAVISVEVNTRLHISAAHPITDSNVHLQAAYVTDHTPGVKSLTVPGATRWTYRGNSECVDEKYSPMDATHNVNLMFHQSVLATSAYQLSNGRSCDPASCQFIQFHGMRDAVCKEETLFISPGFKEEEFYTDNLPALKLAKTVGNMKPDWKVGTALDSSCQFLATKNVFGRVLNGVTPGDECEKKAKIDDSDRLFTHIESHYWTLAPEEFGVWPTALMEVFGKTNGSSITQGARFIVMIFCSVIGSLFC